MNLKMFIFTVKNIFLLLPFFVLISCDKNELISSEIEIQSNQNILSFKTEYDYQQELKKVNSMTEEQRLLWEKENGFQSLGTICNEFYNTIDPKQFNDLDEIKNFVLNNADKIQLVEVSGELYCEPKYNNSTQKYLVNKKLQVCIADKILYLNEEGNLSPDSTSMISSISVKNIISKNNSLSKMKNAFVTEYDVVDTCTIGADNYKMVFTLSTRNEYDSYVTYIVRQVRLKNYARWLAVWWLRTYNSTYTVKVKGTDITYGNWFLDGPNVTKDVKSVDLLYQRIPGPGGSQNTQPRLIWYNIVATNEKGCSINSSQSF